MRTDDELVLAHRAGDSHAFEELFDRYREPIWRFFRRRVADPPRAEELSQETFLALLRSARRYEPRSTFRSYLFGIVCNLLSALRREQRREMAAPLDAIDIAAPGCDAATLLWVREGLAGLDEKDREVLMLREYEQLSYEEIATVAGIAVGTVRSRLFRARLALREKLVAHPETEGVSQ